MVKHSTKKRGGGSCSVVGGKRRSRRSRRMRGGAGYGVGEAIAPGALEYKASYTGAADPKSGAAVPDPTLKGTSMEGSYTGIGGRRRSRKSRKGSKKSRKGSRKMRGGAAQVSAMKAGYGFTGTGSAGLADATPTPTSGGNAF